jgi:hypothetical protein
MTLTQAEAACIPAPSSWRFETADHLHRVRTYLADGFSFPVSTAKVMAEPGRAASLQRMAALGSPVPSDLNSLTGP